MYIKYSLNNNSKDRSQYFTSNKMMMRVLTKQIIQIFKRYSKLIKPEYLVYNKIMKSWVLAQSLDSIKELKENTKGDILRKKAKGWLKKIRYFPVSKTSHQKQLLLK